MRPCPDVRALKLWFVFSPELKLRSQDLASSVTCSLSDRYEIVDGSQGLFSFLIGIEYLCPTVVAF